MTVYGSKRDNNENARLGIHIRYRKRKHDTQICNLKTKQKNYKSENTCLYKVYKHV